jgi:hypothetical protein
MLYFAYGANMDASHMAECCPGALRLGAGVLPGHAFAIAAQGYGRAAPAPGQDLPGVLWELTEADLVALDRFEGIPDGMYRQEMAEVRDADGRLRRAMLYQPTDPAPGRPRPGYLERIIAVGQTLDLPATHLDHLRRLVGTR